MFFCSRSLNLIPFEILEAFISYCFSLGKVFSVLLSSVPPSKHFISCFPFILQNSCFFDWIGKTINNSLCLLSCKSNYKNKVKSHYADYSPWKKAKLFYFINTSCKFIAYCFEWKCSQRPTSRSVQKLKTISYSCVLSWKRSFDSQL